LQRECVTFPLQVDPAHALVVDGVVHGVHLADFQFLEESFFQFDALTLVFDLVLGLRVKELVLLTHVDRILHGIHRGPEPVAHGFVRDAVPDHIVPVDA